jgi:hypothetical protein
MRHDFPIFLSNSFSQRCHILEQRAVKPTFSSLFPISLSADTFDTMGAYDLLPSMGSTRSSVIVYYFYS